jgi:hypothetical protein
MLVRRMNPRKSLSEIIADLDSYGLVLNYFSEKWLFIVQDRKNKNATEIK